MNYDFNIDNPLFFVKTKDILDQSKKYSASLPCRWHEVCYDSEWCFQYPIGEPIERQGWKVHISSTFNDSHKLLLFVSDICHILSIPFKYLQTENKFVIRNGKLINRGYSGKFITCYPSKEKLEIFLEKLEEQLAGFSGPYILSDKKWNEAPIYLRYGVFRPSHSNERKLNIDELLIGEKVVKDLRLPKFVVPEGVEVPRALKSWLADKGHSNVGLPFTVDKVIRFSNSGGIYRGHLKSNNIELIIKEARAFTGLDFDGIYSVERLEAERKSLKLLDDCKETPRLIWDDIIWQHSFIGVECRKGIPLNRWVTNNYPIYRKSDQNKSYLRRAKKIIKQIIKVIEEAHSKNIFHQDIHLGNILIDDSDHVSIIDWEQSVFCDDFKVKHKVAAPGFRAWGENYPSRIDWYGIRQVAAFLYFPVIIQSDLVFNYVYQTRVAGSQLFKGLNYSIFDIRNFENILITLDSKCSAIEDISEKKIIKPFLDSFDIENPDILELFCKKVLRGVTLVTKEWHKQNKNRYFPVHFYGLDINQGIAYSDLGILWACKKLFLDNSNSHEEEFILEKEQIIQNAISNFKNMREYPGLFDGVIGSIWLIYELGEKSLAEKLFVENIQELLSHNSQKNLYSGKAGVLLVSLFFLKKGLGNIAIKQEVLSHLRVFAEEYKASPTLFANIGIGKKQSNDPYENQGGLLYGHAGLGWVFGEAYRYTGDETYKECLNYSVKNELQSYVKDSLGALQHKQGNRLLPYLSNGSAGLLILLLRNQEFIEPNLQRNESVLLDSITPNFCLFPGLFNGYAGLQLVKFLYNAESRLTVKHDYLIGLEKYLCQIEEGVVVAGDNGLKVTTDIASGIAGIALALSSIKSSRFELLPQL